MTFDALRDTSATLMLHGGVPAHVVDRILGHASEAITLSVYAHVTRGMEAQAPAAVQAIFGSPPVPPTIRQVIAELEAAGWRQVRQRAATARSNTRASPGR